MRTAGTVEVLTRAAAKGLQITTDRGDLLIHADRALEPAEADYLRQHKAPLVRELTAVRLDFETFSPLDLEDCGTAIYAAHQETAVIMLAWCIGLGPVQVWLPGDTPPAELLDAVTEGAGPVISHGAFDRIIWYAKLVPLGWPVVPLERWSDTMARARAYRVPAKLEKAAERLGLKHRKDTTGKAIIRRANVAAMGGEQLTDAERAAFIDYCRQNVEVLRELDQRLPELTDFDRQVFELDTKMNDRGLPIDLDLVRALSDVHNAENPDLIARMELLTDGVVTSPAQERRLLAWLNANGAGLANLQRETLERWSEDDPFGGRVAEVVELRQEFAHSAGSKLKKLLTSTSLDGRARRCFVWHGAHTGRWSGRGVQPQNFPRPGEVGDVEATLTALLHPGGPAESDNNMSTKARISACLRATIAAPAGYELVVADFAQIESRVLCWLAGQQDMLDTYRGGGDPYVTTAAALGSPDRQFGKLLVLAAGFGGGVNMLRQKAPGYGLTLSAAEADRAIIAWRNANAAITRFWYALQDALVEVVEMPLGRECRGHRLSVFRKVDDTLRIRLPSGRELIYHQPRMMPNPDHNDRLELAYQQVEKSDWRLKRSWHGNSCENVVQGVAYDLLADAMLRMDAAGIVLIASVHDELIAIAPREQASATLQEMLAIMSAPPTWASGLPLKAEGYLSVRYVKPPKAQPIQDEATAGG
jgi:DNA polymerase